jgi:hypothetical protein
MPYEATEIVWFLAAAKKGAAFPDAILISDQIPHAPQHI